MKNKRQRILRIMTSLFLLASIITPLAAAKEAEQPDLAISFLMGPEIPVSTDDNIKYLPSVAYNWKHHEYLVVWHSDLAGGYAIQGARVSASGAVLATWSISNGTNERAQASVAYDPPNDRYLVVWVYDFYGDSSDWDVYGRFLPWDGPSSSLSEFAVCSWNNHQWKPEVAYARTQEEYLVVWTNLTWGDPYYISGRRVTASGGFPADGFTIASHATLNRINPDVTYNLARNEYLVVWEAAGASRDIWGVRMTGGGVVLGGGEFSIASWPDDEERPAVAACNILDQYLVAWQSLTTLNYDIYARYIAGDGVLGSVHLIDATTGPEEEADVACDMSGQQYLIVWQSLYYGLKYYVHGRLMSSSGPVGSDFAIAPCVWPESRDDASVAGGYSSYLTAWEHFHYEGTTVYWDIYARLVIIPKLFLPLMRRY